MAAVDATSNENATVDRAVIKLLVRYCRKGVVDKSSRKAASVGFFGNIRAPGDINSSCGVSEVKVMMM
jgi:hypothetical protein